MTTSSRIRSAYAIGLLLLVCSFSSKVQANDNPNAQKISITHPLLEGYDLHHPEISPNDSLIAFSASKRDTYTKSTIWIKDVASDKVWQVTKEDSTMVTGDVLVRWSPDLTQLAFASDRGGITSLYIADIKSGTMRKIESEHLITTNSVSGRQESVWYNRVSWTPDSEHIVAIINNEDGGNLYKINVDSHEAIRILQLADEEIYFPDLSKDGKKIIYTKEIGSKIETFDITTSTRQVIEANITGIQYPTWSPNSEWIGFQSYASGEYETYILHLDSGGLIQVGQSNRLAKAPSWNSSGESIIYYANQKQSFALNLKDLSSNKEITLLDDFHPTSVGWWWGSWAADSKRISAVTLDKDQSLGQLNIINIESETVNNVAEIPSYDWSAVFQIPVWLTDNSGLFSIVKIYDQVELAFISIPSFDIEIITNTTEPKHSIAISPDQELVAFVSGEKGKEAIWVYDRVIGDAYKLNQSSGQKTMLAISPSGEKILYLQTVDNFFDSKLVVTDIESGEIKHSIDISNDSSRDRFEYHPIWIDEDTIAFTTGFDNYSHRIWLKKSLLNENEYSIINHPDGSIGQPQLIRGRSHLLYQHPWPLGHAIVQDIKTGESTTLINRYLFSPLMSPDGQSVAFVKTNDDREPASIWRENVAHIVSQNRLP